MARINFSWRTCRNAIASDIAAGPLQNAKDDIVAAGFEDKIETRLGAGLSTIILAYLMQKMGNTSLKTLL